MLAGAASHLVSAKGQRERRRRKCLASAGLGGENGSSNLPEVDATARNAGRISSSRGSEKKIALGFLDELAKASPLGRGAEPSEIAEWVLMAGGSKNTYMTGENIIVSGGYIYA